MPLNDTHFSRLKNKRFKQLTDTLVKCYKSFYGQKVVNAHNKLMFTHIQRKACSFMHASDGSK